MISDRLLFAFRDAAALEHRLLDLESFIEQNRVPDHHANHEWASDAWQARLAKLIENKPELQPYREVCRLYFSRVFEGAES